MSVSPTKIALALAAALAAAAPRATAQCLHVGTGTSLGLLPTSTFGADDEGRSPVTPLGLSFPMAGAPGSPFTHCVVDANGVLFLTNGGPEVGSGTTFYLGSVQAFQGTAGSSPRIAPYWDDLHAASPGNWNVTIDSSVAGRCAITWIDVAEYSAATPAKTFQAELFASGAVAFSYGSMSVTNGTSWVGISIGDGVGDPGPRDLSAAPTVGGGLVYEAFPTGTFDLSDSTITFLPTGTDWLVVRQCGPAIHSPFGTGCYDIQQFDSFYELFPTAAAAAAALTGQSMTLVPFGAGYVALWGGGTYVPPTAGATALGASNDGEHLVVPSTPMPIPGGSTAALYVHDNGFVSTGPGNAGTTVAWNPPQYTTWDPTPNFLQAPVTAWWSWHDFNMQEGGSGLVKHEEAVVGGETILFVTWDDVESYAIPETANRSTVQFQFHLTTGVVVYVWPAITSIGTGASPAFPESTLVGFSTGGPSLDPGSIPLATALPVVTSNDIDPLGLHADPPAVSTATTGTAVTYTTTEMPEYLPGVYLGMNVLSLSPAPGVDLAFLGAPGCRAYVGSFDITTALAGLLPTQGAVIFYPPGMPAGLQVYAQSIALLPPNSLPGGLNDFGLVTSNGVETVIQPL